MEHQQRHDEPDLNLKAHSNSRRFSASSLREDDKSFRSNISIYSTSFSPGYTTSREEIDPSTYSFTTALKALQAKTVYTWEYLSASADGLSLNSKWNDAERYICNPLSGEVPLECLSAKTLSRRITMSAPLIYPSQQVKITLQERKGSRTRDVGTQSSTPRLSSGSPSPSPAPTPSIQHTDTPETETSPQKHKSELQVETKESKNRKRNEGRDRKEMMNCRGCLSLKIKNLWHKPTNKNNKNPDSPTFRHHVNACYKQ